MIVLSKWSTIKAFHLRRRRRRSGRKSGEGRQAAKRAYGTPMPDMVRGAGLEGGLHVHTTVQTSPSAMTSEVLVLRHCVRSTTTDVGAADASDFTDLALPAWGVPPKWCTAQGLDIVERTGARLPGLLGAALAAEAPLRVVADPVLRDADSALALLRGLGREREIVGYIPTSDPKKSYLEGSDCWSPATDAKQNLLEENILNQI